MKTIVFVHQSAEMYGSDKVLFYLAAGIDRKRFSPIVVLPSDGPLKAALEGAGVPVRVLPLVKLSRATFSPLGLLKLPFTVSMSLRAIRRAFLGEKIDVIHSNTLAVLSGGLWAWRENVPHVWHVHEMIVHPSFARRFFPWLLKKLSNKVVCNSNATRDLLTSSEPGLSGRSIVIWNGIEKGCPVNANRPESLRSEFGVGPEDVLVVLAGRINRWKGQGLLVKAANALWEQGVRDVRFLIVGSAPPGQEHFTRSLKEHVAASPARSLITITGFKDDVWTVWDACDIAVVPSTEPEPFGMVAVEAMAAGRPVVAARHGGLTDIVEHDVTGLLFEPGDAAALAASIRTLAASKEKRMSFGLAGLERVREKFSMRVFISSFNTLYDSTVADGK